MNIDTIKIKPTPDFGRIEKALKRNEVPDKVPFYELFSNIEEKIIGDKIKKNDCKDELDYQLKTHITYQYKLGYDYLNAKANFFFTIPQTHTGDTKEGKRDYVKGTDSLISNEEEFEKYPWPDMNNIDFSPMERIKKMIPAGMKIIALSSGGVLENVMWIMGYEPMSYALIENPKLVKAVFEAVGSRIEKLIKTYASMDFVGAIAVGDDMGFKTQTMISPAMMREYVFPWHKRIVNISHSYRKPMILHSCGNLKEIYNDIIACGWDGKHSFEDTIEPIWEFKEKYSNKISCLGGFDMNKICRLSSEEIRKHTRFLIDKCSPSGGFAIGTGNSVANYVPPENLLTMLEEAFNYGRY
ncbi:MAG: uroporphyrinogen decarboxylase family protein [Candidatus Firestonebacteria bacterium]